MSGFRSRFPTVTRWTTDQDLPDIVFRPCFTSVAGGRVPACPPGRRNAPGGAARAATAGAPRARSRAGRIGRCTVGAATRLALPQVTDRTGGRAGQIQRAQRTGTPGTAAHLTATHPGRPAGLRETPPRQFTVAAGASAHTAPHQSHSPHRWRPSPRGSGRGPAGRAGRPAVAAGAPPAAAGAAAGQGRPGREPGGSSRDSGTREGRVAGRRAVPLPSRSRNSRAGGLSRLRRRNTLWVSRLVSAYPARPS